MKYWHAVQLSRFNNCVSGMIKHPTRKVWIHDSWTYPRYWEITFRTMDKFVKEGWVYIEQPDGFCSVEHARLTWEGVMAYNKKLAQVYADNVKRHESVERGMADAKAGRLHDLGSFEQYTLELDDAEEV